MKMALCLCVMPTTEMQRVAIIPARLYVAARIGHATKKKPRRAPGLPTHKRTGEGRACARWNRFVLRVTQR